MDRVSTESTTNTLRVLVCRPQPEADRLCDALHARGWQARALPTLDIVACPETPFTRSALQALDEFDTVIVISPSAARHLAERIDDGWPQWPLGVCWIAVGEKTATLLREHGVNPLVPAPGHETSEGVLALAALSDPRDHRVLLVAGEGGRDEIESRLRERGARVTRLAIYQRIALPYADDQLHADLRDFNPALIVTLSTETLMQLCRLSQNIDYPLSTRTVLVPGPRVAHQAQAHGFTNILIPKAMTEAAILDCIADWTTRITSAQDGS